jgi:PAS domain S-box-containing protein
MSESFSPLILSIEDEKPIRESIKNYLEDYDYRIITAENGLEGLKVFSEKNPDLVLVDIRMPEMDGLQVLSAIRKDNQTTPVIVVSGIGSIEDAVKAIQLGAWDYILKPIQDMSVLLHAVNKALERARLIRENREYQENLEKLVEERTEQLKQKNSELESLNTRLREVVDTTSSLSVAATENIKKFGNVFLEKFASHMAATGGSLYIVENDGLTLIHSVDSRHTPLYIPYPLHEHSVFDRVLQTRQPVLIRDINAERDLESSGWNGYLNGAVLAFPLPDENGNILGVLSIHNKINPPFIEHDKEIGYILANYSCKAIQALEAKEAIKASEEKYRLIFENILDIYFETEASGRLIELSPSAEDLLAYKKEELLNTNLFSLCTSQADGKSFINKIISEKKLTDYELSLSGKQGRYFNFSVNAEAFEKNGKTVIAGTLRDITERKAVEQQTASSLREKVVLLKEIHHRVKNNLQIITSLLNLQSSLLADNEKQEIFRTIENRIQAMALVHERLYQSDNIAYIELGEYLNTLAGELFNTYISYKNPVELIPAEETFKIGINNAIPIGLIANEILTNSFKYAFPAGAAGKIKLSLKKLHNSLILDISDNGSGFADDSIYTCPKTLGLQLIYSLCQQLNAGIEISNSGGVKYSITVPINSSTGSLD